MINADNTTINDSGCLFKTYPYESTISQVGDPLTPVSVHVVLHGPIPWNTLPNNINNALLDILFRPLLHISVLMPPIEIGIPFVTGTDTINYDGHYPPYFFSSDRPQNLSEILKKYAGILDLNIEKSQGEEIEQNRNIFTMISRVLERTKPDGMRGVDDCITRAKRKLVYNTDTDKWKILKPVISKTLSWPARSKRSGIAMRDKRNILNPFAGGLMNI